MKLTKWELYEKLHDEFYNELPQQAINCDVSVWEAHFDKFSKEYKRFHTKELELVEYEEVEEGIEK
jgi:hypothetical protein